MGRRRHLPLRPHQGAGTRSTPSTRRRRRSAGRCTWARVRLHPDRRRSPATSACAAPRSSTRWAGTTTALPTERRVQNYYGVRCDPSLPYDPDFDAARRSRAKHGGPDLAAELRRAVRRARRPRTSRRSRSCGGALGLSVDWSLTYTTIGEARAARVAAGVPAQPRPRRGVPGRGADAVGRRLPHRRRPGRARGPRACPAPTTRCASTASTATRDVVIETTRPELIPACVALVAHPDDERYRRCFGTEVHHAAVRRRVPVRRPPAGRSREGHGHRDDLHVRRHHRRHVVARAAPADAHA